MILLGLSKIDEALTCSRINCYTTPKTEWKTALVKAGKLKNNRLRSVLMCSICCMTTRAWITEWQIFCTRFKTHRPPTLCYVPTITISATIEIGDSNVDKSWWLYQTVTNLVVTCGYPVDCGIFFDCQKIFYD
jgi:hypothetical protein